MMKTRDRTIEKYSIVAKLGAGQLVLYLEAEETHLESTSQDPAKQIPVKLTMKKEPSYKK